MGMRSLRSSGLETRFLRENGFLSTDLLLNLALVPEGQGYQARLVGLAWGTEGWLRQTARHLSKMSGGESVGGFPGFEPPDDDEAYRRKFKNGSCGTQDVYGRVKQILASANQARSAHISASGR